MPTDTPAIVQVVRDALFGMPHAPNTSVFGFVVLKPFTVGRLNAVSFAFLLELAFGSHGVTRFAPLTPKAQAQEQHEVSSDMVIVSLASAAPTVAQYRESVFHELSGPAWLVALCRTCHGPAMFGDVMLLTAATCPVASGTHVYMSRTMMSFGSRVMRFCANTIDAASIEMPRP